MGWIIELLFLFLFGGVVLVSEIWVILIILIFIFLVVEEVFLVVSLFFLFVFVGGD